MFCLNNHIRDENNGNSSIWYYSSSWEHNTTTAAETSHHHQQPPVFVGDGCHVQPDPHLTCLYLGKRHYFHFEDTNTIATPLGDRHVCGGNGGGFGLKGNNNKRARPLYGSGGAAAAAAGGDKTATMVPRCQVEGCHVALLNAKEYHRRHKVCDMHSKAPKVVVLGLEQRFCQQCSRFHVVSEFDDSKRSCRKRLAGHNERRRKSSHSVTSQQALRELIAENRASLMTRQILHFPHQAVQEIRHQHDEDSNYFSQQMFPQTQ